MPLRIPARQAGRMLRGATFQVATSASVPTFFDACRYEYRHGRRGACLAFVAGFGGVGDAGGVAVRPPSLICCSPPVVLGYWSPSGKTRVARNSTGHGRSEPDRPVWQLDT